MRHLHEAMNYFALLVDPKLAQKRENLITVSPEQECTWNVVSGF
jgi:hypothetical protein